MTGYIYKITSPESGVYIGQTRNVLKRISAHRNTKKGRNTPLTRSFKKHGFDAHKFKIIVEVENCSNALLSELEIHYTRLHSSFVDLGLGGLNSTSGGIKYEKSSKERINKLSESAKIFFNRFGSPTNKPIYQFDMSGAFLRSYESSVIAAKTIGVDKSTLSGAANGKQLTCKGFIWSYNKNQKEIERKIKLFNVYKENLKTWISEKTSKWTKEGLVAERNTKDKGHQIIDISTQKIFRTKKDAAKYINKNYATFCRQLKKQGHVDNRFFNHKRVKVDGNN